MKYKKYISTAFVALLLLPLFSAKSTPSVIEDFDVSTITFINEQELIDLGFDTVKYLPEDFNAYQEEISVKEINFMEEELIDLGFETEKYLPKNFNPYKK